MTALPPPRGGSTASVIVLLSPNTPIHPFLPPPHVANPVSKHFTVNRGRSAGLSLPVCHDWLGGSISPKYSHPCVWGTKLPRNLKQGHLPPPVRALFIHAAMLQNDLEDCTTARKDIVIGVGDIHHVCPPSDYLYVYCRYVT